MPVKTSVRKTALAWASVNALAILATSAGSRILQRRRRIRGLSTWTAGFGLDHFLANSAVEDVHEHVHVQVDGRRGIVGERRANELDYMARPNRGELEGAEVGTQASERPVVHRDCSGTPIPSLLRFLKPSVRVLGERERGRPAKPLALDIGKTVAELALRLPPCPSFGLVTEGFHHLLTSSVDVLHPPDDAALARVADDRSTARHRRPFRHGSKRAAAVVSRVAPL
jgi:hypothetical protein